MTDKEKLDLLISGLKVIRTWANNPNYIPKDFKDDAASPIVTACDLLLEKVEVEKT
jgi:hypothetical protein